jgi:hypothetical protein
LLALAQTVLHPSSIDIDAASHVVDVEGFVSVSQSAAPAASRPTISLTGTRVTKLTNDLHGENAVTVLPFTGAQGLLTRFTEVLKNAVPGVYRG